MLYMYNKGLIFLYETDKRNPDLVLTVTDLNTLSLSLSFFLIVIIFVDDKNHHAQSFFRSSIFFFFQYDIKGK